MFLIRLLALVLFLSVTGSAPAQKVNTIGTGSTNIQHYELLPDKAYSFDRVSNDSTLAFSPDHVISDYKDTDYYWVRFRVANSSPHPQKFYVSFYPNLSNTLYFRNPKTGNWQTRAAGYAHADSLRTPGLIPLLLTDDRAEQLYIKVRMSDLHNSKVPVTTYIGVYDAAAFEKQEHASLTIWTATMAIIAIFFLYNTYIYFLFKDKAYLYYLLILAGAMVYITTYQNYTDVFWNARYFTAEMAPPGLYTFSLNMVLQQLSIIMIITGLIQYSRTYLETTVLLPKWDRILIMANKVLALALVLTTIVTISGLFYSYRYSNSITNLLIVGIIILIFYMGFLSLKKGLKQAKYFLIANSLPMIMVLALAVFFTMNITARGPELLPNITVVIHALTLAVALVARVNVIKDELTAKEIEAARLRVDNEQIMLRNQIIEMENQVVNAQVGISKAENEKLQEQLEFNQRELVSATMYVYQKNEMLADLKKQVSALGSDNKEALRQIRSTIQNNLYLDADWDKFRLHFEKVNPKFFDDLLEKHPNLTQNEIRLSAYFHLNLTVKEIATLLNIDPESVRKAKTRMTKKMNNQ